MPNPNGYNPGSSTTAEYRDQNNGNAQEADWKRAQRFLADFQALEARREASGSIPRGEFNDRVRGLVLLLLVVGIIALPLIGMLQSVPVTDFGQYLAPLTGIAGVVIGYMFGHSRNH